MTNIMPIPRLDPTEPNDFDGMFDDVATPPPTKPEPLFEGASAMTVDELLTTMFKPRPEVVQGLIPQGLDILAGAPKMGKSWFSTDVALSVGTGKRCLGHEVDQGDVLLASLEDPPMRLQSRIRKLRPA
jgi:hypothetical protein